VGLEKIKNLRGIFYRKLKEASEREIQESIPGFSIKLTKHFVEFPKEGDISQTNITYPLIEPFAYANIKWEQTTKELIYYVLEPKLTEEEKEILKKISSGMIELIEVGISSIKENVKAMEYLQNNLNKVVKEYGISLTTNQYTKIMYYIYRDFVGFNEIEPFLQDPNIEDIGCDGTGTPMYVVHQKFGSLKTNIMFSDKDELREFVIKLAEKCGRYVSYAEPILSGTLLDGSRVSATLAGDVATRGPTFTIRKFSDKPFSPVDQIELGTVSPEMLAYFWYLMQNGVSMLIVGGVATGKTSLLNTLCMFIPPEAKIVSIEDTRELRIPNEHWIPTLARVGFGIPMPTGEKYGAVSLFDLLKESFRQNPDYVIVGEVRGPEAYVMFQGMSSGHPSISTFHAGSVDTVIKRLITPPIELSPSLLESLDVIVILIHAREKGKSARRVKEVVEIESVDTKTNEVKTRTIFKWSPEKDTYEKVEESLKVQKIVTAKGGKLEDALRDIQIRQRILEWFKEKNMKDYQEVTNIISLYYKEPNKILELIGPITTSVKPTVTPMISVKKEEEPEEHKEPIAIEVKKPRRMVSLIDLLGFKIINEK
jgi:flagellar protein FlaI